jgi:hypothetical protein
MKVCSFNLEAIGDSISRYAWRLRLVTVLACVLEMGCSVHEFAMRTYGKAGPDRSRESYYGTGVVKWVDQDTVGIDFGTMPPPQHDGVVLLVIRESRIVGRVRTMGAYDGDNKRRAIFERKSGSVHVGDKVIGIQNERKYNEAESLL